MRRLRILLTFLLILTLFTQPTQAQSISVTIDSIGVPFNENTGFPFVDSHSRTLVPLRAVLEQFGCTVRWDQAHMTAVAQKNGSIVEVPVGRSVITVNGSEKPNDTAAQVLAGRTYVPVRAVLEAFGASVGWNPYTKTIVVNSTGVPIVIENPVLAGMQKTVVTHVIDGDTLIIDTGEHVRLIGVDTPEKAGPYTQAEYYGEEAAAYTQKALDGKTVYLAKDVSNTDQYDRLLRYVYLEDGTFFNLKLIEEGIARAAIYPPDEKYAQQLGEAERNAQRAGRGLWGGR